MLYLLYPSVIEFIFFIVNKQTTSIPRTFEKLATPLRSTKCLRELSLTSPPSDAGSVTLLYYTNETLYMIRAKYLVFHLAKTQQNIILDV